MENKTQAIEAISSAFALDPNDVSDAIDSITDVYGEGEVSEGIDEIVNLVPPTGEGLSKAEARKLLVSEMDNIIIRKNQRRLRKHRNAVDEWMAAVSEGRKAGRYPKNPIFTKGFNMKRLDQAVFMARQIGGYESLLKVAGY